MSWYSVTINGTVVNIEADEIILDNSNYFYYFRKGKEIVSLWPATAVKRTKLLPDKPKMDGKYEEGAYGPGVGRVSKRSED